MPTGLLPNPAPSASSFPLAKPTRTSTPKRRIPTAADAFQIADTLITAQEERVRKSAIIKAMFDGQPPYPPYKLKDASQSWRSNFNTLEGESSLSNGMTPFYDLMGSTDPVLSVELDDDDPRVEDWSRLAASEFHRFFFNYPALEQVYWQMLYGFVGFNRGFLWWPVPGDPYFKNIPWHRVMFPDGTSTDPDDWELFGLRLNYTVSKLWNLSNSGDAPGWDKGAVIDAIARATIHEPTSQRSEQVELQQMLRDCDLAVSNRSETIRVVVLMVKELSGKWSQLMVEEDAVAQFVDLPDNKKPQPAFLSCRYELFNSPAEVIAPFIYEVLDGSINSMGGLGRKILSMAQVNDRLVNSVVDGALMRAYPLLQAQDASALQKSGILQLGPMHVIAPGYNFLQTNLLADIEGPLVVKQFIDQMLESNTAIFKARLEKPRGNPETATAAQIRFQNATVLTNSSVNRFYQQLDRMFERLWHLVTHPIGNRPGAKAARQFMDTLIAKDVPRGTLEKKPFSVKATRAIGNGSPFARQQAVANLAPFTATFGPRGKLAFTQDAIAAFAGNVKVDRYLPKADILDIPSFQDWMADQENGSMKDGMEPPITDGQDDTRHLQKHVQAMASALQAGSQGGNPVEALAFVQVALSHSVKHTARLPKEDQKQWAAAFAQIQKVASDLMSAVEREQQRMAKLQQQAQELTFEQQLKAQELQADIAMKNQKNQAQLQQRAQRFQQDSVLSDSKTAAEIQRSAAQTSADIAIKRAETSAKIENDRKVADAQAAAAKSKPGSNGD